MSTGNGGSSIDQAVLEAFDQEGYLKDDGTKDLSKVRARIFDVVSKHKVLTKKERTAKALLRGELVANVFPSLIGPDKFGDEEDRSLLEAVYNKINSDLWAMVTANASGPIQRMVGMNMGNGYVMCRTQVGKDRVDAIYVTDDVECIRLDFTRPDNLALERKIEGSTRNREMLVLRQPQNAKVYAGEYDKTLKNALANAHSQLQLTMEAVSNKTPDEEDEESESEG